LFSDLDVRDRN